MSGATRKPGFTVAVLATLLAAVVVLLGAYTRLTHAGLGCPDWPGCYGFVHVPLSEAQLAHAELHFPDAPVEAQKGWNEMIHRYFAGALGLLILGLALHALVRRGRDSQPLKLPLLLLAVVIAQAAFGMWTVTLKLWPQVVTAHLLGGFTTLALLFLLALRLSGRCGAALPGGDPRTGGAGPAPGDRPDRPRRLGQQQLCGGGLHRPAHLPWRVVAADGLRQRLPPDPAHRPQLPRRPARQRRARRST